MKKEELKKIIKFIELETYQLSIDFNYEIEDETLVVELNGWFTDNKAIGIRFQVKEDKVIFHSLSEDWVIADTRTFWIEFMTRIYQ